MSRAPSANSASAPAPSSMTACARPSTGIQPSANPRKTFAGQAFRPAPLTTPMLSLLALFLGSFVVSYILTPICRDVALRAGLVDSPDQKRKLHAHPIPRVGGVPIMAACLLSVLVLVLCGSAAGGMVVRALPSIARLFPAVLVIFAVGLLDDLISL